MQIVSEAVTASAARPRCRGAATTILATLLLVLGMPLALAQGGPIDRGGTLVDALGTDADSLDPHIGSSRVNGWLSLLFDTFLSYVPMEGSETEFEIGPALAESYELVDPLTFQLNLRDDVVFHDGSHFDAHVAKWNIERVMTHEASQARLTVAAVQEVQVVDDYTIRLILSSPQPLMPLYLTPANTQTIYIASQQAFEAMGEEAFGRAPVGSGPFRFERWIPDDRLELVRFDQHWELGEDGQPLPYFDRYVWRVIRDQAVAGVELRAGDVSLYRDPAPQDRMALEQDPELKVQVIPGKDVGYPSLYFSTDPNQTPFASDGRLRLAAQHAIDRQALADTLGFGVASPHDRWTWYPGVAGYDEGLEMYAYDPDLARRLLAEAGYPDGIDIDVKVINLTANVRPLEVIQAMWADVGIRMNIVPTDRVVWLEDAANGNFQALSHSNAAQPDPLLRQESRTGFRSNWGGYSNPEVDALWAAAEVEYDAEVRADLYRQIQRILHEDAYQLLGFRMPSVAVLKSNVMGFTTDWNIRYVWIDD